MRFIRIVGKQPRACMRINASMSSASSPLRFVLLTVGIASAAPLKINGSTTVNLPVAEAAEILRVRKQTRYSGRYTGRE